MVMEEEIFPIPVTMEQILDDSNETDTGFRKMKKRKIKRKSPNRMPKIDKSVHGFDVEKTLSKHGSISPAKKQTRPPQVPVLPITDPNKTAIT